ncbi:MAG: MogA/MoaB family molybdenum cofactor biosynthesis protein [Actinomycetota bacterium]
MSTRSAVVVTVSDSVTAGTRTDESGPAVVDLLLSEGFDVDLVALPDEEALLTELLRDLARTTSLVVTTGGTGFSPRDVTPEATRAVIEREAPGLAEAMRAAGRSSTTFADLSRGVAGIVGSCIVLNLPGSPKGAVESLSAVLEILPHALDHLAGGSGH